MKLEDAIISQAQEAIGFRVNVLEASTEYSIIGNDLDDKILLWNEGARWLYGSRRGGRPGELLDSAFRRGRRPKLAQSANGEGQKSPLVEKRKYEPKQIF